jgi:plasmid stabilization system protein ParE
MLVYRVADGSRLEVIRILHDAMDLTRHIPGSGRT